MKRSTQQVVAAEKWVQCERCDKWRRIPPHAAADEDAQAWECSLNPDPAYNSCQARQQFSDKEIDRRLGLGAAVQASTPSADAKELPPPE
jgi:hypothetical protein